MRFLAALLYLLAGSAGAQVDSWLYCDHTRTDEKLVKVHVALMVGAIERFKKDLPTLTSQVVEFDAYTASVKVTAMRLVCSWQMPGLPPDKHNVISNTMPFLESIPIAAGARPRLGVSVVEREPGLWQAGIGRK